MAGADVVGMARTGSGKTAAFAIPLLEKLKAHSAKVCLITRILLPLCVCMCVCVCACVSVSVYLCVFASSHLSHFLPSPCFLASLLFVLFFQVGIRAIILAPTRELAEQTFRFTKDLGRRTGLRTVLILGGDRCVSTDESPHCLLRSHFQLTL